MISLALRRHAPRMSLALVLALGACSGPTFVPHPEAGIELRWANGDGNVELAQSMADTRCPGPTKHAVLVGESIDRDETLARFSCL